MNDEQSIEVNISKLYKNQNYLQTHIIKHQQTDQWINKYILIRSIHRTLFD